MAVIKPYAELLGTKDLESLLDLFAATLADTNHTHEYFVDWIKVRRNVDSLKVEIGILSSLVGTNEPINELRNILNRYPEAARAIPLLVAVRDRRFKVLEDVSASSMYTELHFDRRVLTDAEREAIVSFCARTGIGSLLTSINTLRDYVLGVEVGLDSNARKNRSGRAMESLINPILDEVAKEYDLTLVKQKQFSYLAHQGIRVPPELKNRKFDWVLLGKRGSANIETNFYSGGGSKPEEIVDSYITRSSELRAANWKFIWVTDGAGWRSMRNQIRKAFASMDYVLNIEFIRRGLLANIVKSL